MKIEAGKKYRRRDGRVVVVGPSNMSDSRFMAAGWHYWPDGIPVGCCADRDEVLIEEVVDDQQELNLHVGGRYRLEDGSEDVIIGDDGDSRDRCFWGEGGECYGENGESSGADAVEYIGEDIPHGSLVPPEKLKLAREMCRLGEEFFASSKSNSPTEGFCVNPGGEDWFWNDSTFRVRRGPLDSWLKDDPQGEVELCDGDEIREFVAERQNIYTTPEESQQVTIEPGEEFTTADVEKVSAAKRLQDDGVVFECIGYSSTSWSAFPDGCRFLADHDAMKYRRKPEPQQADDVHEMVEQIDPEFAEELCGDWSYTLSGTELRREMLRQVESCVCANRQDTYGDAEDNFANIAALANIALQNKLAAPLEPEDVAIFSICIKLARLIQSPEHLDNWIDLGGYAICGGGIMKRKELNAKACEADATV